ncbi:MAG: L-seryl-tRNA(Sec) selenium transferase, partial [Desulfovibrio sp.]|nr:L-seryl-tRNA(Sec) selenium transferase [Desulfovibrio sp.]
MPEQPHVLYQALPSMHTILDAFANAASCGDVRLAALCSTLSAGVPRTSLRESLENFLNDCRSAIAEGRITDVDDLSLPVLLPRLAEHAARQTGPHLRRVLNATGVIIHTNLGRSLLADEAVEAVTQAARYASNLEFDLEEGIRGSRYVHVAPLICRLVGAESAIVVNNNAAAVLLVLDTLCRGREVVVSRGELVEIGGNFRIPAIIE